MDPEPFYRLIGTRRDVRGQFTGEPLDPGKLGRILAAAHAAPSVGMSQPWSFVIIDSPGIKKDFHDHVMAERAAYDATLTEERRRELVKVVHKLAEEGKVAVRHARQMSKDQLKKVEHVSEDEHRRADHELQKVTDDHIKHIDELVKGKEAEIMEV